MGIGIKLRGGGSGGGGGGGIVKVADAAARLGLTPSDGMIVLQLDTDQLYVYDGTTTSWLLLADPAQMGYYRVADAAALAALTPIDGDMAVQLDIDVLYEYDATTTTWLEIANAALRGIYKVADAAALAALTAMLDGDLAIQLDTDVIYQYQLGTTTWEKVGGFGGPGSYAGYDQTTGAVVDIPGVTYVDTVGAYYGKAISPSATVTITDFQMVRMGGSVDGVTGASFTGTNMATQFGTATPTTMANLFPYASYANMQANLTLGNYLGFLDAGTIAGAAVTDYSSFFAAPTIDTATPMNTVRGLNVGAQLGGISATTISGHTSISISDTYGAFLTVTNAAAMNISPNFQPGATANGYTVINANPQLDGIVGFNGYRGIELGGNFGQTTAITVNNHIDFQIHPAYQANASIVAYNGLSLGPTFYEGSTLGTATAIYHNMDVRVSAAGVTGYAHNNNLGNGAAPATITNYNDMNLNPNFGANLTLGNYLGFSIRQNVQAGANITGDVTLIDLGANGSIPVAGAAHGIRVDMQNYATAAMPNALETQGGHVILNANFDTGIHPVQTTGGPYGLNNIGGQLHIAAGFPITGGNFGIGNNLGISLQIEDDIPVDSSGLRLGFIMNGFLTQFGAAAGKTMDSVTFMGAGAQNAILANGTFDEINMFRVIGLLPGSGAVVNNVYGFKIDPTLNAIGAPNAWGFFNDSTSENYLGGSLAIGTGTKTVANADVALEIGSLKAFIPGRLTTAQRNALTAVTGMVIYNTDTNLLEYYNGATWEVVGAKLVIQADLAVTDAVDFVPANTRRQVHQVHGNGGPATPTDIDITTAQEGDELMFIGTDNDNTVTFTSATNTVVNGSCTLAADDTLTLIFVAGKFREFGRNN